MRVSPNLSEVKKKFRHFTLLVVDDSVELRHVVTSIFSKLGFNVLEADGGRRALEIVKTNYISGVLSDIRMPDGDGLELLENVRKLDPTFPVVVLMSGFTDITIEQAVQRGAVTIINKPATGKIMVGTMIKAMTDATLSLDNQAREAVTNGQLDVLKVLVGRDREILYKPDTFGDLLIHLAIEKKQWNTVRYLAEKDCELIFEKNRDQLTPVHLVAEKAQWDLLKFLLAKIISSFGSSSIQLSPEPGEFQALLEFMREKNAPAETVDEFASFVKKR